VEGTNIFAAVFAHNLAQIVPKSLTRSYIANAGTEVVDAAIKMARAATGRAGMVACRKSFHGRSLGALSASDRPEYRDSFEPLLAHVRFVDFGESKQLEDALSEPDVGLFIVEPMQAEAGMHPAPGGYLRRARELCSRFGTILAFDEIQTGMGRTGRVFCAEHQQVSPDCILTGKALGGGVAAISALTTTDPLWKACGADGPRSPFHHSTYGGNTQSCAVGIAAMQELLGERLADRAESSGEYLMTRLRELQTRQPLIKEVRGQGLLIGVELRNPRVKPFSRSGTSERGFLTDVARYLFSGLVVRHLLKKFRIFTAITAHDSNVLRIEPPLNTSKSDLDYFLESLEATLAHMSNFSGATFQALPDIAKYFVNGKLTAAID
jgi:putrescine aminotransferase